MILFGLRYLIKARKARFVNAAHLFFYRGNMQPMSNLALKLSPNNAVPANYMGVWQRHLLETAAIKDDSSLVLWMQTQHYHIDIRLPTSRTGIRLVNKLADYTHDELLILATQQGFAGLTLVTPSTINSSDVCQWVREIDYQTPNDSRDIGKMVFTDADTVIETGMDDAYLEVWRRLNDSREPFIFETTIGMNRNGLKVPAYLMMAGDYVAYARPRHITLPQAASLLQAIDEATASQQLSHDQLLDWLDMEISFGEMLDGNHWQIKHSTLPFKEGQILELPKK